MNTQMTQDKMDQIVRIGRVVSRQPEKMRVRVELPDTVTSPLVTAWLPVLCRRACEDMAYDLPDINDQVLCVFLPIGLEQGFVMGSMFGKQSPPVTNPDKVHRLFRDGTFLEYDRAEHKLTADVKGDVVITATGNVTVTGQTIQLNGQSSITMNAPSIILQGNVSTSAQGGGAGSVTMNGNVRVSNGDVQADLVSLKSHTHEGVQPGGGTSGSPVGGG